MKGKFRIIIKETSMKNTVLWHIDWTTWLNPDTKTQYRIQDYIQMREQQFAESHKSRREDRKGAAPFGILKVLVRLLKSLGRLFLAPSSLRRLRIMWQLVEVT